MVTRVIVIVGHRGIENHSPEQFSAVGFRLVGPAAQVICQQGVGPALTVQVTVTAVEHSQPADESEAQITLIRVVPVEALQHEHSAVADRLQPRLGDVQAATPCEIERREFDLLQVEAIIPGGELGEPKGLRILDRGLRPGTAHAGAGIELFEQMRGHLPPLLNRLRGRDQFSQLMRPVVMALRRGRLDFQPEAQIPCTVLRTMQQVVDLLEVSRAAFKLVLDHAPPPGIGPASRTAPGMPLSWVNSKTCLASGKWNGSSETA